MASLDFFLQINPAGGGGTDRGLFHGWSNTSDLVIEYIEISTTGNTADFGDMVVRRQGARGCGSSTRGVIAGGYDTSILSSMEYVEFATTGNATDYGDLTDGSYDGGGQISSETRGIMALGYVTASFLASNRVDYYTIATGGSAADFGDLTITNYSYHSGQINSTTRGIRAGANAVSVTNTIDYCTIASTGNFTDFGDIIGTGAKWAAGAGSSTRGLITAGQYTNTISYITIASTGNSVDFGDLTFQRYTNAGVSNATRAVFGAGYPVSVATVMDYVTIASTGNATDFGDTSQNSIYQASMCGSHGGV